MEGKILILGGKGKTGRRVAERLEKKNLPIRIGSRSEMPAFDWDTPENWEPVLMGIEKVYITFQPDLAVPDAPEKIRAFVKAAKSAGVQKLVLLSGRGEREAESCENIIINSGLKWVIVRASWFMQNFSEHFFLNAILEGHLIVPKVAALEPFVDTDDIADVVVEALTNTTYSGNIFEVTGPELLSFRQAVHTISESIKRPVTYQEVTMEEYVQILREHQTPEGFIHLITYLFTEVLDGRNESVTDTVQELLNRPPSNFAEFVAKTLRTGVWTPLPTMDF